VSGELHAFVSFAHFDYFFSTILGVIETCRSILVTVGELKWLIVADALKIRSPERCSQRTYVDFRCRLNIESRCLIFLGANSFKYSLLDYRVLQAFAIP
jgi:hypothetical protein